MNKEIIKVIAFIHTYSPDREYGSFMLELMNGFEEIGVELHVIKTNDLVDNLSKNTYSSDIDERKLLQTIKDISPLCIFSSNHGGIGNAIKKNFSTIPVITWMVDRNPFLHHGGSIDTLFRKNDYVITSSTVNVQKLEKRFPILKEKVIYLPFMTNPNSFNSNTIKDINISFIGSVFVNSKVIINIIKNNFNNKELLDNLYSFIDEVKNNYDLDLNARIKYFKLSTVLKHNNLTEEKFLGIIANMISNNKRFNYLSAISDFGLELYGTKNWFTAMKSSPQLVSQFRFGEFIKTRQQLCNIYDRSKISININHHQATTGLGYRVFDIMASNSLLISNYQKKSDLEVLFGVNHPVPIYRNALELKTLVEFYLENEDERLSIVKKCNKLIGSKHTFRQRALEILQILEPEFKASNAGCIIHYNENFFRSKKVKSKKLMELTGFQRKLKKLKNNPKLYFFDSKLYQFLRKLK